jgi:hypothetical protein
MMKASDNLAVLAAQLFNVAAHCHRRAVQESSGAGSRHVPARVEDWNEQYASLTAVVAQLNKGGPVDMAAAETLLARWYVDPYGVAHMVN